MTLYVYANEDENFENILEEIEENSNEECESKFSDLFGSNDYNFSYCKK